MRELGGREELKIACTLACRAGGAVPCRADRGGLVAAPRLGSSARIF